MLSIQRLLRDEGFPCDILELTTFSYVDIFQDSQPRWSVVRYVD